jgi:hypothetical protein
MRDREVQGGVIMEKKDMHKLFLLDLFPTLAKYNLIVVSASKPNRSGAE